MRLFDAGFIAGANTNGNLPWQVQRPFTKRHTRLSVCLIGSNSSLIEFSSIDTSFKSIGWRKCCSFISECAVAYGDSLIPDQMICAGEEGRDSCQVRTTNTAKKFQTSLVPIVLRRVQVLAKTFMTKDNCLYLHFRPRCSHKSTVVLSSLKTCQQSTSVEKPNLTDYTLQILLNLWLTRQMVSVTQVKKFAFSKRYRTEQKIKVQIITISVLLS